MLRVKQIIANLLSNGVKYTEKGSVCLEVICKEFDRDKMKTRLYVSVSDTGMGIRPEDMKKLFTPFDRLDISHTRNIEGTGLGLTIFKQLLHVMGSELVVDSVYGKGSRFSFEIWQGVSDAEPIGDYDPLDQKHNAGHDLENKNIYTAPGKKILVVDDTPMNLQVITGLLKRTKITVETASGGEECISKFGTNDYDLVFLDYRMPVLDGVETLKKLKETYPQKADEVPIIALTASAILGDKEKLINAGFTDYLSKPVNIQDMEGMLMKYIGSGRSESIEESAEDEGNLEIPQSIHDIKELDYQKGLEYCGDADDYLFALETYADSVQEKADQIDLCLKEERYDELALVMHSLKSMSKSIGANSLHEQAKDFEQLTRTGDYEAVQNGVPAFTKKYRELGKKIKACIPIEDAGV
ncbi:MAG: response regulator [Butyrivibrio sp.]|nr:response regulator [Butyrivibrio sp.]